MDSTLVLTWAIVSVIPVSLLLVYRAVKRHDRMLVKRPDLAGPDEVDPQAAQDRVVNRSIGSTGTGGHG